MKYPSTKSENSPKCSIIMPAYNVENYIENSIKSIINQSFFDYELIIVDDCSTDSTYNRILKIKSQDERIKVFRNKKNLKISETLNIALSHSRGEYIIRMDADDISAPDRIERLMSEITKGNKFDIIGSSITVINEDGTQLSNTRYSSNPVYINSILKYSTPLAHIWICKKDVYDKLNGYRNLSGAEDYDFLLRAHSSGYLMTNISDYYGYKVRIRSDNTSRTMGLKQIKLHGYVWKLYNERIIKGEDSFPNKLDIIKKENNILELIHNISNILLQLSIKHKKKYFFSIPLLLASLISPYQIKYLHRRLMLRIIKWRFKE